jgi:GNAT superfamily N-acetyltransferase
MKPPAGSPSDLSADPPSDWPQAPRHAQEHGRPRDTGTDHPAHRPAPPHGDLRRVLPTDDHQPLLDLIRCEFAFMEGRIDPPSSMHRLTCAAIAEQAAVGEIWAVGEADTPVACVFFTVKTPALYVGKLSVAASHRGRGLARRLIDLAAERAGVLGLGHLELEARIELVENQAAFASMGFVKTGETAHPGYDRPTSVTMQKALAPQLHLPGQSPLKPARS